MYFYISEFKLQSQMQYITAKHQIVIQSFVKQLNTFELLSSRSYRQAYCALTVQIGCMVGLYFIATCDVDHFTYFATEHAQFKSDWT